MITTGNRYFSDPAAQRSVDLLVVGGGITGCGVALDAASRGLTVLLVEQHDLAAHTSSRSSKLVHGGIRYLEQMDFGLVSESLREQKRLITTLAPYHVRPLNFTMPLKRLGFKAFYYRMGTLLYDLLGRRARRDRSRLLGANGLKRNLGFVSSDYRAGLLYQDALMDDVRLVLSVAHSAVDRGAHLVTGTRVTGAEKAADGFAISLATSNSEESIIAKKVILAVGAYANTMPALFGEAPIHVTPSKGSHILVPRARLEGQTAFVGKTATSVLFCIPFDHHWVIGTTEAPVASLTDGERISADEITYILNELNSYLKKPLRREDVIGGFAGVRPLVSAKTNNTAKLSRSHVVVDTALGATLVSGGKYTTYRVMAEDAVDHAFKGTATPSSTATTPLWGAEGWQGEKHAVTALVSRFSLSEDQATRLVHRYGMKAAHVLDSAENSTRALEPLYESGPLWAEVLFAVRHEGASSLTDILHRRLRLDLAREDAGLSVANEVLAFLKDQYASYPLDELAELAAFTESCKVLRDMPS